MNKKKNKPNQTELGESLAILKDNIQALQEIGQDKQEPTKTAEKPFLESYYQVVLSGARAGVWFYDVGVNKHGDFYHKPAIKLSDPFKIVGYGQDNAENEYRVIEYRRNGTRQFKQVALPMADLGTKDGWAFLRSLGIGVVQNASCLGHLANYCQWHGEKTEWQIVQRGGWVDSEYSAFVLPNGAIIGKPDNHVIYTGDKSRKEAYNASGSLKDWQDNVARYIQGNSRLMLALGAVFASPLLALTKTENGGFHFFGSSSIGKSITGLCAVSVLGDPMGIKVQWKGTSLGFDNEAASANDSLIFLDEISEADPKTVKEAGYSIFNGVSKLQGAKQGGNRARLTWRVLAISTGEFDAEHYLQKAGFEWNAGQAVRLPSVPADTGKGLGVFDVLHDKESSKELAIHLESASKRFYGTAWVEYLTKLSQAISTDLNGFMKQLESLVLQFSQSLPKDLSSQEMRTAKRFTLVAVALELAGMYGVTGFERGAGLRDVLTCFDAWRSTDGGGNREERQIIKRAKDLLAKYGTSERFPIVENIFQYTDPYLLGYRRMDKSSQKTYFYLLDETFEKEICGGFDPKFTAEVLLKAGWLVCDKDKSRKRYKRRLVYNATGIGREFSIDERLYCLMGVNPPERESNSEALEGGYGDRAGKQWEYESKPYGSHRG